MSFRRTGFHMAKGLFADRREHLQKWATEIAALPPTEVWHYYEKSQLDESRKILSRTEKFFGVHDGISSLMLSSNLQELLCELMGEEPILFKEKLNYKYKGNAGFEPHQDIQAGWQSYADYFVSVGIAVDPQLLSGGCLQFIHDNFGQRLVGELWNPLKPTQVDFDRFEPQPCDPGDVMFFDGYVPHRSMPNTEVDSQRIFYLSFNRKSAGSFREKYYDDKFRNFPPDHYRTAESKYEYKV
jgi:2-aminoethylphosphonate dioxygenase